jgi:hypothetical protein
MRVYVRSLRALLEGDIAIIAPARLSHRRRREIERLIEHRRQREDKVLRRWRAGTVTIEEYCRSSTPASVDVIAASRSLLAHLLKLVREADVAYSVRTCQRHPERTARGGACLHAVPALHCGDSGSEARTTVTRAEPLQRTREDGHDLNLRRERADDIDAGHVHQLAKLLESHLHSLEITKDATGRRAGP